MTCHNCNTLCKKFGKHRNGLQRYRCRQCLKTFTEEHAEPLDGMYTPVAKAAQVLELLLEGCSISSAARIADIRQGTILSLLTVAGAKCERLFDARIRNVSVSEVQCDEIWGYVGKKEGHKWMDELNRQDIGDAYTFVAIERRSKLILAWHLGKRNSQSTNEFIGKLDAATGRSRFQITTDGWPAYPDAIDCHLSDRVDYGQLVKVYGASREGEQRYSPDEVINAVPTPVIGNPAMDRICTSHIERQNLTMRMQLRRLTRLTNAFSKKWANLKAALALYFAWYYFCRMHKTLRCTPAMAAGVTDHVWGIAELITEAGRA